MLLRTILVASALLAVCTALDYPRPADAFSSDVALRVSDYQGSQEYHGAMYHNTNARQQLLSFPSDSFSRLERWDMDRMFEFNPHGTQCTTRGSSNAENAHIWQWLSAAAWKGTTEIGAVVCQQWEYSYGSTHFAGCFNGNRPVALAIASGSVKLQYYFQNFKAFAPSASTFDVPQFCDSASGFAVTTQEESERTAFLQNHLSI